MAYNARQDKEKWDELHREQDLNIPLAEELKILMHKFECDVCGDEVSYSERIFKLRNGLKIVICSKCLKKKKIKLR